MYRKFSSFMIMIACMILSNNLFAKDLGKIGAVYPIAENDLKLVMQNRVAHLQETGGIINLQNHFEDEVMKKMDRPKPLEGITTTLSPRNFTYDPTVTVSQNITDNNGNIIVPKGAVSNYLNTAVHTKTLLFYNADNESQSKWAFDLDRKLKGNDEIILVGGSVFDESKKLNKRVYFDQMGMISNRLNITHVPAMVSQEGNHLLIQEVLP